jgi:dihydroneopterin aldolase
MERTREIKVESVERSANNAVDQITGRNNRNEIITVKLSRPCYHNIEAGDHVEINANGTARLRRKADHLAKLLPR